MVKNGVGEGKLVIAVASAASKASGSVEINQFGASAKDQSFPSAPIASQKQDFAVGAGTGKVELIFPISDTEGFGLARDIVVTISNSGSDVVNYSLEMNQAPGLPQIAMD